MEELNALVKAKKKDAIINHLTRVFNTQGETFTIVLSKTSEQTIDELVDLISLYLKDRNSFYPFVVTDYLLVATDLISFATLPPPRVNFVGYRSSLKNFLKVILAHKRGEASEKSWEEEIDEALKIMEKIAKKAKPREDAAELVRRFRDA